MTDRFDKFEKWLTPLKEDGRRGIRKDAPEHIKEEAKKVNEEYTTKELADMCCTMTRM